jgi:hypothetical protein
MIGTLTDGSYLETNTFTVTVTCTITTLDVPSPTGISDPTNY